MLKWIQYHIGGVRGKWLQYDVNIGWGGEGGGVSGYRWKWVGILWTIPNDDIDFNFENKLL